MTTFKPFTGNDETRQRNALFSWFSLGKSVEVFVFGVPPAPDDLIAQFNIKNYPDADWNNTGMPKLDEMFEIAQRDGNNKYLAYVNGDMVLGADFVKALNVPKWKRFLLVGQRWDTDFLRTIKNESPEEIEKFRNEATCQGALRGPTGIDFFAFPKGTFPQTPPLVPGGVAWDGYMIHYSKKHNIPVIDSTPDVLAIHQNHSYNHNAKGERILDIGPAARNNWAVASADNPRNGYTPCTIENSQYFLKNGRIHLTIFSIPYVKHRIYYLLVKFSKMTGIYQLIKNKR